jgi:outer membrane protein assembly factor BamA
LSFTIIQAQQKVSIKEIKIEGLTRTKPQVIKYELDFNEGDSIDITKISTKIFENEKRILNTGLFTFANINIKEWDEKNNFLIVVIKIKEGWHLYPAPIFELADRNFNVWRKEMCYDMDRVNYGLRVDHLSFTGMKDKLKLKYQIGYTRKYEIEYMYPYLKNGWGLGVTSFYSENKEIGYKNQGNLVLFKKYEDERILLKRMRFGLSGTKRSSAFVNHLVSVEYHYNKTNPIVAQELNADYFPKGYDHINYLRLEYLYKFNQTIFPIYPEGGHAAQFQFKAYLLGNYTNASAQFDIEKHYRITPKIFFNNKIRLKANLTKNKVPYANNSALGYGENLIRGYDLYVMDGTEFVWYKNAIKFNALDSKINMGKYMPLKAFKVLPIRIFARFSVETAYAYERDYIQTNKLNNKILLGYGPAIDVLLYNNFLLSAEYNYNIEGEGGIFYKSSFNF